MYFRISYRGSAGNCGDQEDAGNAPRRSRHAGHSCTDRCTQARRKCTDRCNKKIAFPDSSRHPAALKKNNKKYHFLNISRVSKKRT